MKWCLGDPCFSLGIFLNLLRTLDIGEGSTQDILKHPLVCLKTIGTKIFLVLIMWCYPFRLFFVHSRPFLRQPRASAHMSNTLQNKRRHTIPSRVWTFIHHAGTHPTLVTGKIKNHGKSCCLNQRWSRFPQGQRHLSDDHTAGVASRHHTIHGTIVYLPTKIVDFYGFNVGKYTRTWMVWHH